MSEEIEQKSLIQIIIFSLLPGVLYVILSLAITPAIILLGYPTLFVLILADLFIIVLLELVVLLYIAKKKGDKITLKNVVPYTKKLPIIQILGYAAALIVYGYLISMLLSPVSTILKDSLFSWMPEVFLNETVDPASFSPPVLITTGILALIIIGIAVPIVEELYFRGFLMSRISRLGGIWAPLLIVVLWSLYHMWAPWNIVTFIVLYFPIAWVVRRKENIYISIIAHSIANLLLVLVITMGMLA